jgi:undecaprenyl-diphosphatase
MTSLKTARTRHLLVAGAAVLASVIVIAAAVATTDELTVADAIVLGVVEGITEYLPISSTGHLTVVSRLLGIGTTDADRAAADAYAIAIQLGAILAVLILYRARIGSMLRGLGGRDPGGRSVALALIASMVPAAALGFVVGDTIKEELFGVGPVAFAWLVGAAAIFVMGPRWRGGLRRLEDITVRDGLVIGLAQALALWPGVSRSLVTILAALALGLAVGAAVEYSFLLGLGTLGGATLYELATEGGTIVETFGWVAPVVGLLAAFVSAVIAVRWLVAYLEHHSLVIFAWYRLVAAGIAGALLLTGVV